MCILSIIKGNLIMEITAATTNSVRPKLYRLTLVSDEEIKKPECSADVFKRNGHGYEVTPGYEPATFGAYVRILNSLDDEVNRDSFTKESVGFHHTSVKANFEGEPVKLVKRLKFILPDPSKYEEGQVILVDKKLLLINFPTPSNKPGWRVITEFGAKLSDKEWLEIQEILGLFRPLPKVEPHGVTLVRDNLRGKANIIEILREKLPDPENCLEKEFSLPSGKKLYLRSQCGTRVWVVLPEDKISLSVAEKKEIESFLGLEFTMGDYPSVDKKNDIVCWGICVEDSFRGVYKNILEKIKKKLPDPETHEGKTYDLKADGKEQTLTTFIKKRNKSGYLVWTVPKFLHSDVAKNLELRIKLKFSEVPKDAVILTGSKAQDFWVEAGSNSHHLRRFYRLIKEKIEDPDSYNDPSIIFENRDLKKRCRIYLSQKKHSRFWYVLRKDYALAAEVLNLTPKDPSVRALKEIPEGDNDLLSLIAQQKNPRPVEFDNRDDGTDRKDLQLIRGGRRIARVREGLEPGRKKKNIN